MADSAGSGLPHWGDAASYAELLRSDRAAFAWEWLRRQPTFRDAALDAIGRREGDGSAEEAKALAWHLHRFEDPRLPAMLARPVWAASAHPWVLGAFAERSGPDEDSFVLEQFMALAKIVESRAAQHLLLSDGYRSIRLDVTGVSLVSPPVRLLFDVSGIRALERPLLVLRRLRSLAIGRRFSVSLHPQVRQARRLVTLLRAFDALDAGASHADIAAGILSRDFDRQRWRVHSPSLRSRAQRLANAARRMGNGEFWRLLE